MKKIKVVYIHGNETMTWKRDLSLYLKKELNKMGLYTVFETFPDSILARAKYWVPFMKDYLNVDENTLLIGHSSGANAAMRFSQNNKVFGSILISPCHTDLGKESERNSGWFDEPWDWNKIKDNQKEIGLIYSTDDAHIPFKEFEHINESLNPNYVLEFNDRGHFGWKQKEFPELVSLVQKMLQIKN